MESARHFNPRSPHGERPVQCDCCCFGLRFQSTLPARGATYSFLAARRHSSISIHAPRTGSDEYIHRRTFKRTANFNPRSPHGERLQSIWHTAGSFHISIHAPRTGSDQLYELGMLSPTQFQSTLPARGATKSRKEHGMAQEFQSTLPARGATRWFGRSPKQNSISIHAPRTGSDSYSNFAYARCKNFNPRSPHGERRFRPEPVAPTQDISIHAPRTGSDENKRKRRTAGKFQSTLPARGATPSTAQWRQASRNFNPRSPHGERPAQNYNKLYAA